MVIWTSHKHVFCTAFEKAKWRSGRHSNTYSVLPLRRLGGDLDVTQSKRSVQSNFVEFKGKTRSLN